MLGRTGWGLGACTLLSVGCSSQVFLEWPELPGLASLVIDLGPGDGMASRIYGAGAAEALFATAAGAPERVVAVAFDHDLDALDLPAGPIVGSGRPLPPSLGVYVSQDGGPLVQSALTPSFELPRRDWSAVLGRGRCAEGADYSTTVCGSTVSFEPAEPAPPRLTDEAGRCPSGWSLKPHAIDRGLLGPQSIGLCEPPARVRCGPSQLQSTSDVSCRPIGPACDPGSPFRPGLTDTPAMAFVRAGAPGGDGTRSAPFSTIQEALRTPGIRAVVVGRGVYVEDVTLSGSVELVGACAAETVLRGRLLLSGHQGRVSGLSVEAALDAPSLVVEGASHSELVGVALLGGRASVQGGELQAEGSLLAAQAWSLGDARWRTSSSELRGHLQAVRSAVQWFDTERTGEAGVVDVLEDSDLQISASRLAVPFDLAGGSIGLTDAWIAVSWPPLLEHGAFAFVADATVSVTRSTFDARGVLVDPSVAQPYRATLSVARPAAPLTLEDTVFLGDLVPQEGRASSLGLAFSAPPGGPMHHIRRVVAEGQRAGGINLTGAQVEVEDFAGYDLGGNIVVAGDSLLTLRRIRGVRCGSGVEVVGTSSAVVEDLSFHQGTGHGLSTISETLLSLRARRVLLDGEGPEAVRIQQRSGTAQPEQITLRQLRVRGQWNSALRVLERSSLTVVDFDFADTAHGALIGSDGTRLSRGHIQAGLVGILVSAPSVNLPLLLQQVVIDAPTTLSAEP